MYNTNTDAWIMFDNNKSQSGSSNFPVQSRRQSRWLYHFQNDKRGNNTTFNQGGTVMNNQNDKRGIVMNTTVINNQNDKRGTVMNTTFNQGGTVMNNQNDLIIGDEYKCLAMTINYWR